MRLRRMWQVGAAYVGGVIGAGYASGQEQLRFFLAFGSLGLYGMVLATFLFFVLGALLLEGARRTRSRSHRALLDALCPAPAARILDTLLTVALFGALAIMFAAGASILQAFVEWPASLGILFGAAITTAIVRRGTNAFLRINGALVVILITILIGLLIPEVRSKPFPGAVPQQVLPLGLVPDQWVLAAILYVLYNLALVFPLFASLGGHLHDRATVIGGASVGALGMGTLGFLILVAMLHYMPDLAKAEVPLLLVVAARAPQFVWLYVPAMLLAVLTSCVGAAYALSERLCAQYGLQRSVAAPLVSYAAVPLAHLGFVMLVQTLYPLLGYVGAFLLLLGLLKWRAGQAGAT